MLNLTILSNAWVQVNNVEFYNYHETSQPLEINQHNIGWTFKTKEGFYNVSDKKLNLQQAIELSENMGVLKD